MNLGGTIRIEGVSNLVGYRHTALRVGGAGCDDDLVHVGPTACPDLLAGVFEHATGAPPSEVEGGGVAGSARSKHGPAPSAT